MNCGIDKFIAITLDAGRASCMDVERRGGNYSSGDVCKDCSVGR